MSNDVILSGMGDHVPHVGGNGMVVYFGESAKNPQPVSGLHVRFGGELSGRTMLVNFVPHSGTTRGRYQWCHLLSGSDTPYDTEGRAVVLRPGVGDIYGPDPACVPLGHEDRDMVSSTYTVPPITVADIEAAVEEVRLLRQSGGVTGDLLSFDQDLYISLLNQTPSPPDTHTHITGLGIDPLLTVPGYSLSGIPSGTILSGYGSISSGVIGGLSVVSGDSPPEIYMHCSHLRDRPATWLLSDMVHVAGISGFSMWLCWRCAGFDCDKGRFYNREDAIRESVPPAYADLPPPILADWCDDNLRERDAIYLRSLPYSGKLLESNVY